MTTPPTPTVYQSRSRTTRKRLLIVAAVLVLVLAGWLIGRLQGGSPASGSSGPPSAPPPATSAEPSPTEPSPSPTPAAPTGVDAYKDLQAEGAAGQNGVQAQDSEDKGGGQNIGWVANGDSLRFDDVNFADTPATGLVARVASAVGDGVNGRMEIRIDSATNPPVGSLPIASTGGWQTWRSQATDISAVTGVHTVFLTFAADRGDDFLNLNYIKFSR
jgi:hypothetical protein